MDDRIKSNITFSVFEKIGIILSQFISSILLSKYLPREEFGAIAVISGAYAFLQFVNIAIENILIKDYQKFQSSINETLSQFIQINILKTMVLFICCIVVGAIYYNQTERAVFIYTSLSLFFVLAMDIIISPLIIYASLLFKQEIVTKVSLIRWTLNIIGLSFLIRFPSIKTVLIKDLFILIFVILLWLHQAKKELHLSLRVSKINWNFLRENFVGYSLWVHLIGVISNIVYKADAFILYYFVSLKLIGNYNIALSVANIANIIPSILINQNNVALSHCKTVEESKVLTGKFLRLSIYLGVISFGGFSVFGKMYLSLITKTDIDEIYGYLLLIAGGLLVVRMVISPLVAFVNIKGDVRGLLMRVQIPLLITVLINYTLFSYLYGTRGAAISNLLNSFLWLIFLFIEIKTYEFKISDVGSFKSDYNQVKNYVKRRFSASR